MSKKIINVKEGKTVKAKLRNVFDISQKDFDLPLPSHQELAERYEEAFQSVPARQLPINQLPLAVISEVFPLQALMAIYMIAASQPSRFMQLASEKDGKFGSFVTELEEGILPITSKKAFTSGLLKKGQGPKLTSEELLTFFIEGTRVLLSVADSFSAKEGLTVNGFVPGEATLPAPYLFGLSPSTDVDFDNMASVKKEKDLYNFFKHFSAFNFFNRNAALAVGKNKYEHTLNSAAEAWLESKVCGLSDSQYKKAIPSFPAELCRKFLFRVKDGNGNSRLVFGCDLVFDYSVASGHVHKNRAPKFEGRPSWAFQSATDLTVRNVCLLDPPVKEGQVSTAVSATSKAVSKTTFFGNPLGTLKVGVYFSDDGQVSITVHPTLMLMQDSKHSLFANSYFCESTHATYHMYEGTTHMSVLTDFFGKFKSLPFEKFLTGLNLPTGKKGNQDYWEEGGVRQAYRPNNHKGSVSTMTGGPNHTELLKVKLTNFENFLQDLSKPKDNKHFNKDFLNLFSTSGSGSDTALFQYGTLFSVLLAGTKRFYKQDVTDMHGLVEAAFDNIFFWSYASKDSFLVRWFTSLEGVDKYMTSLFSTLIPPAFKGVLEDTEKFPTVSEFDVDLEGQDSAKRGYKSGVVDIQNNEKLGLTTITAATAVCVNPVQSSALQGVGKTFISESRNFFNTKKAEDKLKATVKVDEDFNDD